MKNFKKVVFGLLAMLVMVTGVNAQVANGTETTFNGSVNDEDGLRKCMDEFVREGYRIDQRRAVSEAYFDRVLHTHTKLSEFNGIKQKVKYIIARYTPYFAYKRIRNR